MPVVHIHVWEGFGKENAKKVIEGITKVFTNLEIPAEAVHVVLHETPKTHWGMGGRPASSVANH